MIKNMNLIVSIVLMAISPAFATQSDGLEGTWEGFLAPSPLAETRVILRVEKGPGGALRARAESPEVRSQPPTEFEEVTVTDRAVALVSKKDGREFRGTLNPAGTALVGDLKRGPVSVPIAFEKLDGPVVPAEVWEGSLEVNGGIKLRLALPCLEAQGWDDPGDDGQPRPGDLRAQGQQGRGLRGRP